MRRIKKYCGMALMLVVTGIIISGYSYANNKKGGKKYTITITNVTSNQVITTPLAIIHEKSFELFKFGEKSSSELATLAEDGDLSPLEEALDARSDVLEHVRGSGSLAPGATVTIEVESKGKFKNISIAGMLASTNDAFFAVNNFVLPNYGKSNIMALAYDAGSEKNNESCDFVPGPPCGSHFARDTDDAEGFVYVHSGIHGIGDMDAAMFDWRGPVAYVTILPESR